jgi:hypothetical protein
MKSNETLGINNLEKRGRSVGVFAGKLSMLGVNEFFRLRVDSFLLGRLFL